MINLDWDMLASMSDKELKEFVNKPKAQREAEFLEARTLKYADEPQLISCPKCHGTGEYNYDFLETDENGKFLHNDNKCDVCYGTGKVTLEFYEDLQRGCRR